jgi:ATP-dependent DNA helicase RecG
MKNYTAQELFELLNQQDECEWIEAKGGHESSHSVMETVCAFANEPGLDGGYILMGVAEDKTALFPQYKTVHISDPDKFQRDFVSQCSSMFNMPVRPKVSVEKVDRHTVIKVQVDENALKRYRNLRERVNPVAEELSYTDAELLKALGCLNRENKAELNMAGLLLFGTSKALRAYCPMLRVDYIRVPGNKWVEDPDNRFTTIDMRGPLLILIYRLIDAINSDLPNGFLLPEEDIQASSIGFPTKALREAIVNALMHRSYREHRPIQVIRYDNRIEIINPGYSLKAEEHLGEPGSETRNPFIAAVFHETNLAETKGSGIRAMRKLMAEAHLAPPTFDSDRNSNQFTSRLLLHHFLNESDLIWLHYFSAYDLTDSQKQALIFVREVGAIDNQTYRQMADCDTLKASNELRALKANNLLAQKGKGKSTYYITGEKLSAPPQTISTPPVDELSTPPVDELSTPPTVLSTPPQELLERITKLNQREHDVDKIKQIIKDLCSIKSMKASEIASYLNKGDDYIKRKYLAEMIQDKELVYLYPEMLNHPEQAYIAKK